LKNELYELRKFRNKWVHVKDPIDDSALLERPEYQENKLQEFALKTIRTMLTIIYSSQWI
jgi:hypothetical protein